MYFDSFETMLQMDGHGGYVWAAYAITLVVIAAIVIVPVRRQRSLLLQLRGELKRQQAADTNRKEGA